MKHPADTRNIEAENTLADNTSVARELLRLPVVVAGLGYLVDMLALLTTGIALVSLWSLNETFHKDMNYNEGDERGEKV